MDLPQHRSTRPLLALVVALLALLGAAPAAAAALPAPPGTAWLRAAHAVPGLAGMDITVRPAAGGAEVVLAAGARYGEVTGYLPLPSGDYVATVRAPGGGSAPVLTGEVLARPGQALTLAALGTTAVPRLAVLVDDLSPPSAGTARLRLLPASASARTVTVAAVDGPVVAQDAAFGEVTPYAEVPAGPWTLSVTGGGAVVTTDVVLDAGGVYTVLVTDGQDGALTLLTVTDAASSAVVPPGSVPAGLGGTAPTAGPAPVAAAVLVAGAALLLAGGRRALRARSASGSA